MLGMWKKLKAVLVIIFSITVLLMPLAWGISTANAAAAEQSNKTEVPVVLIHKVNPAITDKSNLYQTTIAIFKQFMKYLNDNGYTTLSAKQYYDIITGKVTPPAKPILLTFDDGTPDFYTNAYPVLKKYHMKAIEFIVKDWINNYGMSTDQLKALAKDPNINLENHTKNHKDMTKMDKAAIMDEITADNQYLKSITGKEPWVVAYPYGAYNSQVEQIEKTQGIKMAFKVGGGITAPSDDIYGLGRAMVLVHDTLPAIAAKIDGPAPSQLTQHQTVKKEKAVKGKEIQVLGASRDAALTAKSHSGTSLSAKITILVIVLMLLVLSSYMFIRKGSK